MATRQNDQRWQSPDYIEAMQRFCAEAYYAEMRAFELCGAWIPRVEDFSKKLFIGQQCYDERRHTVVFARRLRELGMAPQEAAEKYVDPRLQAARETSPHADIFTDWVGTVMGMHLVVEGFALLAFQTFLESPNLDPVTKGLLPGIIAEEETHVKFGEKEMRRIVESGTKERHHIREIGQRCIEMLGFLFDPQTPLRQRRGELFAKLGLPVLESSDAMVARVVDAHSARMRRIGLPDLAAI